jgi:hypothetical protein
LSQLTESQAPIEFDVVLTAATSSVPFWIESFSTRSWLVWYSKSSCSGTKYGFPEPAKVMFVTHANVVASRTAMSDGPPPAIPMYSSSEMLSNAMEMIV